MDLPAKAGAPPVPPKRLSIISQELKPPLHPKPQGVLARTLSTEKHPYVNLDQKGAAGSTKSKS